MKKINVEAFLNQMSTGISAPSLILGDDGESYILKKQKSGEYNFDSMFLNEAIAYELAKHLEIPMPDCAIGNIDKELVDLDRDIVFVHKFFEGLHFASKEIENVENNLVDNFIEMFQMGKPYIKRTWNEFFKNISNKRDIAKVICFDLLIANFDRYNHEANFILTDDDGDTKFYAIDHGHSFFGPIWSQDKMNQLDGYSRNPNFLNEYMNKHITGVTRGKTNMGMIFKALETNVNIIDIENHDFKEIIYQIECLDEKFLRDILRQLPDEWYINKQLQTDYFVNFIMNHKLNIRNCIQYLVDNNYFTNYRGGQLLWKEEPLKDVIQ